MHADPALKRWAIFRRPYGPSTHWRTSLNNRDQPNVEDEGRRCQKCGYNLTGLTEPRCPECGLYQSIWSETLDANPNSSGSVLRGLMKACCITSAVILGLTILDVCRSETPNFVFGPNFWSNLLILFIQAPLCVLGLFSWIICAFWAEDADGYYSTCSMLLVVLFIASWVVMCIGD